MSGNTSAGGHKDIVEFPLNNGANIEAQNKGGWTALALASCHGHKDTVELLLNWGANVNLQDAFGWTALMNASYFRHLDTAKLLVWSGADPNARNSMGDSVLMLASCTIDHEYERNAELVDFLLASGAKMDLMSAVERGDCNAVERCLADGEDPNVKIVKFDDQNCISALMVASRNGRTDIVELLLGAGADRNYDWTDGRPAFVYALNQGHMDTVKSLVSATSTDSDIPYSDIALSWLIPQSTEIERRDYVNVVKMVVVARLNRAVKDPAFGMAMQRDIKEILDGKTDEYRNPLTGEDRTLLMKVLKTLRSIDYTDRQSKISASVDANEHEDNEGTSPIYDMEL